MESAAKMQLESLYKPRARKIVLTSVISLVPNKLNRLWKQNRYPKQMKVENNFFPDKPTYAIAFFCCLGEWADSALSQRDKKKCH